MKASFLDGIGRAWGYVARSFVWAGVFAIRAYQCVIRPHLIGCCNYAPSCSEYAAEALSTHGLWRGSMLSVRRLCRCHPFARGGIDPVPPLYTSDSTHIA